MTRPRPPQSASSGAKQKTGRGARKHTHREREMEGAVAAPQGDVLEELRREGWDGMVLRIEGGAKGGCCLPSFPPFLPYFPSLLSYNHRRRTHARTQQGEREGRQRDHFMAES